MDEMTAAYWAEAFMEKQRDHSADKSLWNKMAPGFAHKPRRSDYISLLTERLELEEGDSVFDMGCGSGTLAIPLAKRGHRVFAVDFSEGMLEQMESAMPDEIRPLVVSFNRAWQDDWGDLPQADVAISSRSLIVDDLPDAIAKLESKAKKRAVITVVAGQTPWRDERINDALGREPLDANGPSEFIALFNYLLTSGRFPRVDYIEYPRTYASTSIDELMDFIERAVEPQGEEVALLHAFIDEHALRLEDGSVTLDYQSTNRWALIWWPTNQL